jgi:phthiodiolone/phenolphthiodiolone dimycocerosates ketoreductase
MAMVKVSVGYQDSCLHPLRISTAGMRIARLMGAEAIWFPDHFMGFAPKWMWTPDVVPVARIIHSMDALFDPVPMMTLAALKHRRVLIGTSVTDPIRRHPMSLAQTFVTLDHISKGRTILGIGSGLRENTEPYGLDPEKRVARLDEALKIIRMLWNSDGKPASFEGRFWELKDAVFDIPLFHGKPPRLFIGAHFPRMLGMCGRWADGWLPGQKVDAAEYGSRLGVICEAADGANRPMRDFTACHTALVAFGASRDQVLDRALKNKYCAYMAMGLPPEVWTEYGLEHPMGPDFPGFIEIVPSRLGEREVERALEQLTVPLLERVFYVGTPEQILDELAPMAGAGCRHFIIANMGALFTGRGVKDLWDMGKLMRGLKKLEARTP